MLVLIAASARGRSRRQLVATFSEMTVSAARSLRRRGRRRAGALVLRLSGIAKPSGAHEASFTLAHYLGEVAR